MLTGPSGRGPCWGGTRRASHCLILWVGEGDAGAMRRGLETPVGRTRQQCPGLLFFLREFPLFKRHPLSGPALPRSQATGSPPRPPIRQQRQRLTRGRSPDYRPNY